MGAQGEGGGAKGWGFNNISRETLRGTTTYPLEVTSGSKTRVQDCHGSVMLSKPRATLTFSAKLALHPIGSIASYRGTRDKEDRPSPVTQSRVMDSMLGRIWGSVREL